MHDNSDHVEAGFFGVARRFTIGGMLHTIAVHFHAIGRRSNPQKVWQRYAACLVVEGYGSYVDHRGREHRVEPGCLVHHLPGRYHHIEREEAGWQEYVLGLDDEACRRWIAAGLIDEDQPVQRVARTGKALAVHRRLYEHLLADDPTFWPQAMLLAGEFLLRLREAAEEFAARADPHATLAAIAQTLAIDYQATYDLESLAAEYGISYPTLRRRFRQHFGISLNRYRLERRLDHAALLLAHQGLGLCEVADQLGYSDPFVFSRQFKQYHGISPSAYRDTNYEV